MTREQRRAIEAEIERLIDQLDQADGDTDREPDDDDAEHDGSEPDGAAFVWSVAA